MSTTLDIHQVLKHLPHRYPFLLIDKVLSYTPGQSLIALKNVSYNEPFFPGHFPQRPVMPGVLIVEAMAQATGLLAYAGRPAQTADRGLYYLVGIDDARFKQPVQPGDQLIIEVALERNVREVWKFNGTARVDGKLAASATILCARGKDEVD
jgi:3-hydroxyacyl-[acyl-carrier-protein] dehydratase